VTKQRGLGLLRTARLTRRQLISFALASAAINGVITATVGAWLAQTYAVHQSRRQAIENIAHHVYERRTRAGMVVSAIRRDAEIDEVRHRKRAYDEAYVDWNKNVLLNLFAIREAAGELKISTLEPNFEDGLVAGMADVDRCLTQGYDRRLAGEDAKAVLEACRMGELHQFTLDCGATFTNELYKLTQLTFSPFGSEREQVRAAAEANIRSACVRSALAPTPVPAVKLKPPAEPAAVAEPPAAPAAPAPQPVEPQAGPQPVETQAVGPRP
jgi:hypothetical protein